MTEAVRARPARRRQLPAPCMSCSSPLSASRCEIVAIVTWCVGPGCGVQRGRGRGSCGVLFSRASRRACSWWADRAWGPSRRVGRIGGVLEGRSDRGRQTAWPERLLRVSGLQGAVRRVYRAGEPDHGRVDLGPDNVGMLDWAVFRWSGSDWRLLMKQRQAAILTRRRI